MTNLYNNPTVRLIIALVVISAAVWYLQSQKPESASPEGGNVSTASTSTKGRTDAIPAPEIVNPSGFINTDTVSMQDLIGKKVILVDFWTYSCINCQRTLPYITDWYSKYKDQGLEVVGIHTPEFEFEKKYDNVVAATKKFGVEYPVVLDNDYGTWRAYGNRYWPRKYLIDINGNIVYDHIGEGGYDETEMEIQKLLMERAEKLGENSTVDTVALTQENTDAIEAGSPETYFGAARNELLANGRVGATGPQTFTYPASFLTNRLYLKGTWTITDEYAQSDSSDAAITFQYRAKKVYMVARADSPTELRVLIDGKEVGSVTIQADELYTLVDGTEFGEHTMELIPEKPGIQAFTFTFG